MAVLHSEHARLTVNGAALDGVLVEPDDGQRHPGVVLIQEWWGIEPHVLELAHKLAAAGFVTFVPDHYHGRVCTEPDEAGKEMMLLFENLERAIKEIGASIEYLRSRPNVEPKKIGVIGFCMGGLLTFKAAERFGDQVGAAVPFYGVNYTPKPEEVAQVRAPILAIFGRDDPFVPLEQVRQIEETYRAAGKDIRVSVYPAGHAFVNPDHGNLDPDSAEKAWNEAITFLRERLR
jgi:carboxymethylenebutenolidase